MQVSRIWSSCALGVGAADMDRDGGADADGEVDVGVVVEVDVVVEVEVLARRAVAGGLVGAACRGMGRRAKRIFGGRGRMGGRGGS